MPQRTRAALTTGLLHWLSSRRSTTVTAVSRTTSASRPLASTTRRCTQRSRAPRLPRASHRATARRACAESRRNGSLDAWPKISAIVQRHAAETVNDARTIALRASGRLRDLRWRVTVDSFESGLGYRGGGAAARSSSTESADMACLGLRRSNRLRAGAQPGRGDSALAVVAGWRPVGRAVSERAAAVARFSPVTRRRMISDGAVARETSRRLRESSEGEGRQKAVAGHAVHGRASCGELGVT